MNPITIRAVAVVTPAQDSVTITAEDMARLREVDKRIPFTRSWKVAMLMPPSR